MTVSIGVAIAEPATIEAARLDDLIQRADAALYQAKARGRNQVVQGA